MLKLTARSAILSALLAAALSASAAPAVSYTVSGTAGAYLLDFSVTNTLGGTNGIYFFGVEPASVASSPLGYDDHHNDGWSNASYGGSSRTYASTWVDNTVTGFAIAPGDTLSGFVVSVAQLPTSPVNWFAFAYGDTYTGTDYFNSSTNPGFEGTANAVPEPASFAALGLGAVALLRRRRKA